MEQYKLIFNSMPTVMLSSNLFINVPIILRYEDTNLIELVSEANFGYTTQIPIYHSDGTYLAKVKGNRVYPTKDGEKAGIRIDKHPSLWVCQMGSQTLFELHQSSDTSFKTTAELYTPDGYFIKCSDSPKVGIIDTSGESLKVGGVIMSNNIIQGSTVGVWVHKNGVVDIGVNTKF